MMARIVEFDHFIKAPCFWLFYIITNKNIYTNRIEWNMIYNKYTNH